MATAAVLPAQHDVQTQLNYYKPIGDERPFQYTYTPPEGTPSNNLGNETHPVTVQDVRGREDTVSLDTTGFQYVRHASAEKEFLDEEKITTGYYQEVEDLLKREVGVKRVVIFDHTIRRNYDLSKPGSEPDRRGPVQRVHIDQTYDASVARVRRHLGDDAERLLKGRVRIINVWRPIGHPVAHNPLATADWRTLSPEDLVPVRFIYPDREGGIYSVRYNPQHRWYYLSDQTPEEVTLIKCYDSEEDKARLTPHSAFFDASSPASAPQRQSIEVRALVFDSE